MYTVEEFRTRFPEFSNTATYKDARIQLFLDDAAMCIDEDKYGSSYNMAIYYHAAHDLTLATQTASSSGNATSVGPVSSKAAGQVSKTHAINNVDLGDQDVYYQQTQYGLKFLNIRNKMKIPGFLVITPS